MPRAIQIDNNLFADVLTKISSLSVSQQRFIHEMLAGTIKQPLSSKKSLLKKSFGIWSERSDISDSVTYVNEIRTGWTNRIGKIEP